MIDATIGSVFEIELVDLNNDGRQDLLVTTNGANGTLLAFEVPDDFRSVYNILHLEKYVANTYNQDKSGRLNFAHLNKPIITHSTTHT